MSLYLAMLPFEARADFSHAVLTMDALMLEEPVGDVERRFGRRVPERFNTYLCRARDEEAPTGSAHYGNTQHTAYGEPMMYVRAVDLLPLAGHPAVLDSYGAREAWAYLAALSVPAAWRVALYWY